MELDFITARTVVNNRHVSKQQQKIQLFQVCSNYSKCVRVDPPLSHRIGSAQRVIVSIPRAVE